MDHVRKLERMYLDAPCNDRYQPEIDLTVEEGETELTLPVREDDFHATVTSLRS